MAENFSNGPEHIVDIEELKASPVKATWEDSFREHLGMYEPTRKLSLTLGSGDLTTAPASLGAELTTGLDGAPVMASETVLVNEHFAGNNLGEKMARALAVVAVQQGCKRIMADYRDPRSLKQAIKIFGFERIHFLGNSEHPELSLSEDEALTLVTQRRASVDNPNLIDVPATPAWIDIDGLDVSQWDAVQETQN